MLVKWIVNLLIAVCFMSAWQFAGATTVNGAILVGERSKVQHTTVKLEAGKYRIHLLDPFGNEDFALDSAGVLLSQGTVRFAQLSLPAGTNTATVSFESASTVELDLFVHASTGLNSGAAVVAIDSLSEVGDEHRVFEQVFTFGKQDSDSDRYTYRDSVKLNNDSSLRVELADMHAFGLGLAPFESIIVRFANTSATEVLGTWCWYKGLVSAEDSTTCVNIDDLTAAEGQLLSQTFEVQAGFVSWYVTAKAPSGQQSQLGWKLVDVSLGIDVGEDVVIVNRTGNNYVRELGRFSIASRSAIDVKLNPFSDVVSPFNIVILSNESGDSIRLSDGEMARSGIILNAGEYRVLLSDDLSGERGLIGINVDAGLIPLFDDVFSLGDFQRLGDIESLTSGNTPVTLSLHELRNPVDVRIANGDEVVLGLTDGEQTGTFDRVPGRYSLWGRFDAGAPDDLYRVRVGSGSALLGDFLAATGTRLVEQRQWSLSQPVSGSMQVRNFAFPDALVERFRMVLVQDSATPLKFDVDNDDGDVVQADVDLSAGTAHIALFASQDVPGDATVIGYRFEYDSDSSGPVNPPRGANGSGGSGGSGGSLSSFLLYSLLVFKFARQKQRAAKR